MKLGGVLFFLIVSECTGVVVRKIEEVREVSCLDWFIRVFFLRFYIEKKIYGSGIKIE